MNNESAFPQNTAYIAPNGATGYYGPQGGMTLRDYFAAKAMQSLASEMPDSDVARHAYELADAMLRERSK